jgi:hypothetical protein
MITLKIIESILSGYPLVNMQKTMEITMFNGKINYTWPFSIAMLNYQRVNGGFHKWGNGYPKHGFFLLENQF